MTEQKHIYDSPEVVVIKTDIEGVLCESNMESVGQNPGTWDGI